MLVITILTLFAFSFAFWAVTSDGTLTPYAIDRVLGHFRLVIGKLNFAVGRCNDTAPACQHHLCFSAVALDASDAADTVVFVSFYFITEFVITDANVLKPFLLVQCRNTITADVKRW